MSYIYHGLIEELPIGVAHTQTLNATTTPNAAIARQTGKIITQNTTPGATIVRVITKPAINATTTPNATIVRLPGKILTINTTPSTAVVRSALKSVLASSTPNATMVRSTGKVVTQNTTPNATMVEAKQTLYHQTLVIDTTPNATIGALYVPKGTATLPPHRGVLIIGKLTHRNP